MEKICGVYMIQSKIKPERVYIGSSSNIYKRWRGHKSELSRGRHRSSKLQNHYNKYGKDDLCFIIIEQFQFISKEHLLSREQYYLDSLNPYFCICKSATNTRLGCKSSEEHKRKIGESNKGRKMTEEQIRAMSAKLKGRKLPKEVGEKISKALKGKPKSEEHKQHMRGRVNSKETRTKQSIAKKGTKAPWMIEYNKGNTYGRKNKGRKLGPQSEEIKQKKRIKMLGRRRAKKGETRPPLDKNSC